MHKFSNFIVNHIKSIITIFLVLMVIGGILSRGVGVNLDNISYLPDDINSKKAILKLGDEFGIKGSASLLIENKEVYEIVELKESISNIEGVKDVIWLDDFTDISQPSEFIDPDYIEQFYKEDAALLQILFTDINESELTYSALYEIENLVDEDYALAGPSVISRNMVAISEKEIKIYSAVGIGLIILILFTSTSSWIEPFIFLITIGSAIYMNKGLNIINGETSQVTRAAANIIQFAVCMDYMIFLLHRFHDERHKCSNVKEAMVKSIELSYKPIVASAITTIAGFVALGFMDFGIGRDLGLGLARGVSLSLVAVLTFLPALVIAFDKWIERFSHKDLAPKFNLISKISIKGRYVSVIIIFVFAGLFFLAQNKVGYNYSNANNLPIGNSAFIAQEQIDDIYGIKNSNRIIVPNTDKIKETELVAELNALPEIDSALSLYSKAGTEIPDMMVSEALKENFISDDYSMIQINLNTGKEDAEAFAAVDTIRNTIGEYYDEYYVAGEAFSYKDLDAVTNNDFTKTTFLSLFFIFVILAVTFKSLSIPAITVFIIQATIWINIGIAYFLGSTMNFVSFVIIGAIQLGATVDYGILYINRYKENLVNMSPLSAATISIKQTAKSIITSGCILVAGTFSVYFIASLRTASEVCLLIGRGAILSMVSVLFVLPGFLIILEPIIKRTTFNWPTNTKTNNKKYERC